LPSESEHDREFFFGPFHLLATQRLLLEGDKPVRLGSRALDILIALVERAGKLATHDEIREIVWPDTTVVEANLTVHVVALRRALRDGQGACRYIVNIPGRGYSFVAPVTCPDRQEPPPPRFATSTHPHNLPAQLTRLIGRAAVVDSLVQELATQRLVTIVGTGGIGKTAVAFEVAKQLIGGCEDGVWLIDLAPIDDPRSVPTALACTLGLDIRSDNPLPGFAAALRQKRILLVLDNCEHVIEAAAALVDGILTGARGVRILATSREPLRVNGERVCRLLTLENPPKSVPLSAADTLRFPAVQLFVERAAAATGEFELNDADARYVSDICRKLDGIPLAIEFAAARVDALGVRGLSAHLDDCLRLLKSGRRTASPRHRTISATLEWSYQLLGQEEQTVLRRLAVFVGGFTLESACAAAADADLSPPDIADAVASLVEKSLVSVEIGNEATRFRLLETTRAYVLAKLAGTGEAEAVAQNADAKAEEDLAAA
jgi:predicted ATPase/DNA-binding winged helix-turn-helix (wHTH) protein